MAAAQLALNDEKEAAKLVIQAFQYKPKDERALSNRALAHLLLGEVEKAKEYANQTLEKKFYKYGCLCYSHWNFC